MNNYNQIFRRKSFHKFNNTIPLNDDDLNIINTAIKNAVPLDKSIKVVTKLVKEAETSCKLGAEYCILFYSEKKDFYLENIGYIGEQIDLYLTANNIGTLWCGLGKTKASSFDGLDYVIMICVAKVNEAEFRKDLSSFKRKPLSGTWEGELLPFSKTAKLAPSAVNSQPWYVVNKETELLVYRNNKAAKFGIIPLKIMKYYNQIDMGIYLLILETCLIHDNYSYSRELSTNKSVIKDSKVLTTIYSYNKKNNL